MNRYVSRLLLLTGLLVPSIAFAAAAAVQSGLCPLPWCALGCGQ